MTERLEQCYYMKFCQKLGDSQVETIRKIQTTRKPNPSRHSGSNVTKIKEGPMWFMPAMSLFSALFCLTFNFRTFTTNWTYISSFPFLSDFIQRFPGCSFTSPVRHVPGFHIGLLLEPFRRSHIVGACAQRLWSGLTTFPAHLHLTSCSANDMSIYF